MSRRAEPAWSLRFIEPPCAKPRRKRARAALAAASLTSLSRPVGSDDPSGAEDLVIPSGHVGLRRSIGAEHQERLRRLVASTNACTVDGECQVAFLGCPLGCEVAVRADRVDDVTKKAASLIQQTENDNHQGCTYSCAQSKARCAQGRCALEIDTPIRGADGGVQSVDCGADAGGQLPGAARCQSLMAAYQDALSSARVCTVGAGGQCGTMITRPFSCHCASFINGAADAGAAAALDSAGSGWSRAGCADTGPISPAPKADAAPAATLRPTRPDQTVPNQDRVSARPLICRYRHPLSSFDRHEATFNRNSLQAAASSASAWSRPSRAALGGAKCQSRIRENVGERATRNAKSLASPGNVFPTALEAQLESRA